MVTALSSPPGKEALPPKRMLDKGDYDHLNKCDGFDDSAESYATFARRKRRKHVSPTRTFLTWVVDHQIEISTNLLLCLYFMHTLFPSLHDYTTPFFRLSYYQPTSATYTRGLLDFYFIAFWVVVFSGLRAATMNFVLFPLASMAGLKKEKAKVRFAEQAWLLVYYFAFWPLGLYLIYDKPYVTNLQELWTKFPTPEISFLLKFYYLVQWAFWIQQIVVVNIEERRKDHWQMFTHHIVTCTLMLFSYGFYETNVGNMILVLMDVVDITLSGAKILKYAGYHTACDIAFGVFIFSWILARHILYLRVVWSIWIDFPLMTPYGCYSSVTGAKLSNDGGNDILSNVLQPFLNPGGPVCFNRSILYAFIGLLLFLQGITLAWLVLILRVAWKVITGQGAEDSRSDDEGEGEDDDVAVEEEPGDVKKPGKKPIEIVADGSSISRPMSRSNSPMSGVGQRGSKASGSSRGGAGLSLRGGRPGKELLGRIGCDKPT